jgi:hypothetical protein
MIGDQLLYVSCIGLYITEASLPVPVVDVVSESRRIDNSELHGVSHRFTHDRVMNHFDIETPFLQVCLEDLHFSSLIQLF